MKTCLKIVLVLLPAFIALHSNAQIGIGANPPHPSAMLHVQDTAKGLLIPRMTEAQKNAIQNPATGLLIYQTDEAEGMWIYKNNQWQNMASQNNGGKHTLILADRITNAEAQAKIAAETGPNTQEVRIIRCTNLTAVDLSMLTSVTQLIITDNSLLQNVSLNSLKYIDEILSVKNCPQLSALSLPLLEKIGDSYVAGQGGFQLLNTGVTNINFPLLRQIDGPASIIENTLLSGLDLPSLELAASLEVNFNASLLSINLPVATELAAYFRCSQNPILASILMPQLTNAGAIMLFSRKLTTCSLTSLQTIGSIDIQQCAMMSAFAFPSLTSVTNSMSLTGNKILNNLSVPVLTNVGTLSFASDSALVSVSCPALASGIVTFYNQTPTTTVSLPSLLSGGFRIQQGSSTTSTISSLNMPVFTTGEITIEGPVGLTSLSLPSFTSGSFTLINSPSVTAVSMPLAVLTAATVRSNINLTSFGFSGFGNTSVSSFDLSYNKFNSSLVNYILAKLVSAMPLIAASTITLNQFPPAPPTSQGITDKALLTGRGNTVSTD